MKLPSPDHPITLTPAATRWQATFRGQIIADSTGAIPSAMIAQLHLGGNTVQFILCRAVRQQCCTQLFDWVTRLPRFHFVH